MDWVALSLIAAVAFTAYTLLQKRALDRHVSGAAAFAAMSALAHIGIAGLILIVSPPDWLSWGVAAMAVAGVIQGGVQLLTGYALRRATDVSRIVPVLDAHPLLVMVMAVLWLGEALTPLKWGAALMVVVGVMIASFYQTLPGDRLRLNGSVLAIVAAAIGIACYSILVKSVAGQMSVWQMYALSWMFAFPGLMAAARISGMGRVTSALRSKNALTVVGLAQVVLLLAFISSLMAIELGPVSLTTAIMSTRPVLLLLWMAATGLSLRRVVERREPFREARVRWGSAVLVVAGVGVMAL